MKRLLTAVAVAALAAGLSAPSSATMMSGHSMMGMKCPKGMHYVKAYKNKMGHMVAGHCSH